jgi:hypothetical protein
MKVRILGLVKYASNGDLATVLRQRERFDRALAFWDAAPDFLPPDGVAIYDMREDSRVHSWAEGAEAVARDFRPTHVVIWGHDEPWNQAFRDAVAGAAPQARMVYVEVGLWPGTFWCAAFMHYVEPERIRGSWVPGMASTPDNLQRLATYTDAIYGPDGARAGARDDFVLLVPQYPDGRAPFYATGRHCDIAWMMQSIAPCIPDGTEAWLKVHPLDLTDSWMREAARLDVHVLPREEPIYPLVARAAAVVTVNSVVGLHAMLAGTPVLALGQAYYAGIAGVRMRALEPQRRSQALNVREPGGDFDRWLREIGPALKETLATEVDPATADDFCCHTMRFCEAVR